MYILDVCEGLTPIVKIIKKGIIPIVQIAVPIILILLGTIDLGRAVISSDQKEIKEAQSLLIKRFIYAAAVFLIVTFVTIIMSIVGNGASETGNWAKCWASVK